VVIARYPCVLLPEERRKQRRPYRSDLAKCVGCRLCLGLGCPAITWNAVTPQEGKELGLKEKQQGYTIIDPVLCNGCGQCGAVCKPEAIAIEEGAL